MGLGGWRRSALERPVLRPRRLLSGPSQLHSRRAALHLLHAQLELGQDGWQLTGLRRAERLCLWWSHSNGDDHELPTDDRVGLQRLIRASLEPGVADFDLWR